MKKKKVLITILVALTAMCYVQLFNCTSVLADTYTTEDGEKVELTDDELREMGYTDEEIEALKEQEKRWAYIEEVREEEERKREEEENPTYTYDDVAKTVDEVKVTASEKLSKKVSGLDPGKTIVHPIDISEDCDYAVGFVGSDDSFGKGGIQIVDANGTVVYERDFDLYGRDNYETVKLASGKYQIKILARGSFDLQYHLIVKSCKVNKTQKVKMPSCEFREFDPGIGAGKWKTSDSEIVTITDTTEDKSMCTVQGRKPGTATVTYTNDSGSVVKYKVTVKEDKALPFSFAGSKMKYPGKCSLSLRVTNNSTKKIKSGSVTVSYYNGDTNLSGKITKSFKLTVKPWDQDWYEFGTLYTNINTTGFKIEKLTVKYADGTTKSVTVNKEFNIDDY